VGGLREAGAAELAAALARRAAAHAPSTTRATWPSCWIGCGQRARRSRPPRWLADCRGPGLFGLFPKQQGGQDLPGHACWPVGVRV